MKILQIHNRYRDPGGEDAVVASEAEALRRAGHEVVQHQVENPPGRLEALGAKRVARVETWWVLEAPTGQRFCVVRTQRGPLGDDANTWP